MPKSTKKKVKKKAAKVENHIHRGKAFGLNSKQRKWAEEVASGTEPTYATEAVYKPSTKDYRKVATYRLSSNQKIRDYINLLLMKGLEKTPQVLLEALNAKTIYKGMEVDAPDHKTRLAAWKAMIETLDRFEPKTPNKVELHDHLHVEGDIPKNVLEYMHTHGTPDFQKFKELLEENIVDGELVSDE